MLLRSDQGDIHQTSPSTTCEADIKVRPQLLDIRRTRVTTELRKDILEGLSHEPLKLPPLLLWNDEGLDLFNTLANTPAYYLQRKELEILNRHVEAMVEEIPSESVLIELGCGNLQKTAAILFALEQSKKYIRYYALDVSPGELSDSLQKLAVKLRGSHYVSICGLLGTYEDCVAWLTKLASSQLGRSKVVTFLWMGNSIANYEFDEASCVMATFVDTLNKAKISSRFLLAIDACRQTQKIFSAYDRSSSALSDFILNGLRHANIILGSPVFNLDEWDCICACDPDGRHLRVYYTPLNYVELSLNGRQVIFGPDSKIQAILSGKWLPSDVQNLANVAGLSIFNAWCDQERAYYFYSLR